MSVRATEGRAVPAQLIHNMVRRLIAKDIDPRALISTKMRQRLMYSLTVNISAIN